ncbi:nucleotide exchange factor SIL1-like, partial [Plectropomus leopardus]|uniref:nucleotide exchange factor SIL1-like n=1 Tax=Plectropomus leopardus TaxID=160734 RepID=UPI001C4CF8CE
TMKLTPCSTTGASFSCLTLAVLLLLHCCHIGSIFGQKSDSALTVVENTEGAEAVVGDEEEEVVVDEDEGDLEVIQPNEEWQTLKPGQAVPAGSHVRLNLQTGQREVRLGEEQLKYWTQEHRETEESRHSFSPEELKRAVKKMKEDMNPASRDAEQQ